MLSHIFVALIFRNHVLLCIYDYTLLYFLCKGCTFAFIVNFCFVVTKGLRPLRRYGMTLGILSRLFLCLQHKDSYDYIPSLLDLAGVMVFIHIPGS